MRNFQKLLGSIVDRLTSVIRFGGICGQDVTKLPRHDGAAAFRNELEHGFCVTSHR
jgi:hypothetical protein